MNSFEKIFFIWQTTGGYKFLFRLKVFYERLKENNWI